MLQVLQLPNIRVLSPYIFLYCKDRDTTAAEQFFLALGRPGEVSACSLSSSPLLLFFQAMPTPCALLDAVSTSGPPQLVGAWHDLPTQAAACCVPAS